MLQPYVDRASLAEATRPANLERVRFFELNLPVTPLRSPDAVRMLHKVGRTCSTE